MYQLVYLQYFVLVFVNVSECCLEESNPDIVCAPLFCYVCSDVFHVVLGPLSLFHART